MKGPTEVRGKMPPHAYLYTGMDKEQAGFALHVARLAGCKVDWQAKPVLGSNTLYHYTLIAFGLPQGQLDQLRLDINGGMQ